AKQLSFPEPRQSRRAVHTLFHRRGSLQVQGLASGKNACGYAPKARTATNEGRQERPPGSGVKARAGEGCALLEFRDATAVVAAWRWVGVAPPRADPDRRAAPRPT